MRIWEIINPFDTVTFLAEDYRYAVAVTLLLGSGTYGLKECFPNTEDGPFEMPIFTFSSAQDFKNWFTQTFTEEGFTDLEELLTALDKLRLAEILRTVQVCSPVERESYQKALEAIDDLEKRREYMRWWKEQRRQSSMMDITLAAWKAANAVEKKFLEEYQQSVLQ